MMMMKSEYCEIGPKQLVANPAPNTQFSMITVGKITEMSAKIFHEIA